MHGVTVCFVSGISRLYKKLITHNCQAYFAASVFIFDEHLAFSEQISADGGSVQIVLFSQLTSLVA